MSSDRSAAATQSGREAKHIVCLVIDRLSAGYLGPYGNTWIETPELDRLAGQSFLFDQAIIDTPELAGLYRAYWQGAHAVSHPEPASDNGLIAAIRASGRQTWLVSDEPEIVSLGAAEFDLCISLAAEDTDATHERAVADNLESTGAARFFSAATELLDDLDEPTFVWLHARGMAGPWDAPLEFRNAQAAEDDPEPHRSAQVPGLRLAEDYDPDELLGITQAYAGQLTCWDACFGVFLDALDDLKLVDDLTLIVLSTRGFPLGQHLLVGSQADEVGEPLYGELVHVPLFVRLPGRKASAVRSASFVQPADLYGALMAWCARDPALEDDKAGLLDIIERPEREIHDRATIAGPGGQWAIRTPAWFLRGAEGDTPELYVKPDDRWEINDVADRCVDIVAGLEAAYEAATCDAAPPPLQEILRSGLE